MVIGDNVPFQVKDFQAEANALFNQDWTVGLHDVAVTRNTEATVGTDRFQSRALDSMPYGQDDDWEQQSSEIQQAGHTFLRGSVPSYTDVGGSILTSLHNVMAFSQTQSDTTRRMETANTTALLDSTKQLHQLPFSTPAKVPKRASKRKLIKAVFSHKKPCLPPSSLNLMEDLSASMTNLPLKLAIRTEFVDKTTTTTGTMSSKQPSSDYSSVRPRGDLVPA